MKEIIEEFIYHAENKPDKINQKDLIQSWEEDYNTSKERTLNIFDNLPNLNELELLVQVMTRAITILEDSPEVKLNRPSRPGSDVTAIQQRFKQLQSLEGRFKVLISILSLDNVIKEVEETETEEAQAKIERDGRENFTFQFHIVGASENEDNSHISTILMIQNATNQLLESHLNFVNSIRGLHMQKHKQTIYNETNKFSHSLTDFINYIAEMVIDD